MISIKSATTGKKSIKLNYESNNSQRYERSNLLNKVQRLLDPK